MSLSIGYRMGSRKGALDGWWLKNKRSGSLQANCADR